MTIGLRKDRLKNEPTTGNINWNIMFQLIFRTAVGLANDMEGDVFYVRVAAQTLAYKVERIRKVDPDDLRDVRIQPGRDLVTLVTCTPIFLNTYRLLVTGERVSMPDDAPYPEDAPRTTGRDARPLLVSGVALLAGMPVAMVESRPRVRPYGRHGMKR